jgi:hypothetical protein
MIQIDFTLLYNILGYLNHLVDEFNYDLMTTPSTWGMIWLLLFKYQLWLLFIYIFLRYLAYPEYMYNIQSKWFMENYNPVILAIDVPKRNEQSLQAMENFFDHLQGVHGTFTKKEIYLQGAFQMSLSVELVSIEGNIQYLIRCPGGWRNLVEAAVYAQYPDAEITEVVDYTNSVPKDYPSETHDLWGVEFTLSNPNVYLPIKSWLKFEHKFSEKFVDPMAALLETMSSIGKGEQIWLQLILTPLPVDWGVKKGKEAVNKFLKIPEPAKKAGIVSTIIGQTANLASEFTEQLAGINLTGGAEKKDEKSPPPSMMMYLSPSQREQVEAMERKISKLAFNTKIRYIYVAEKERMNKMIGVNSIIGAIKQWNDMNMNGLKPCLKETGTSRPAYYLVNYRRNTRKNIIIRAYKNRSTVVGMSGKPMCSEELASLWHFPSMDLKAPLVKSTSYIKRSAPVGLPIQSGGLQAVKPKKIEEVIAEKTKDIPHFDYDSDDFEMQFAKDKEAFLKSRSARAKRLQEIKAEDQKIAELKKKAEEKKSAKPVAVKEKTELKQADIKSTPVVSQPENNRGGLPGNLPFID